MKRINKALDLSAVKITKVQLQTIHGGPTRRAD